MKLYDTINAKKIKIENITKMMIDDHNLDETVNQTNIQSNGILLYKIVTKTEMKRKNKPKNTIRRHPASSNTSMTNK